jgi:hypothetical protein
VQKKQIQFKKLITNKIYTMKKSFVFMAIIAFALIITSCAKAPQAELDAAKAALEQAKVAQADMFLVSDFNALQDSINKATTEIEAQKSKLLGNYKTAKQTLATTAAMATELVEKTALKKEEVKQEILASQAEIAGLMEENIKLVAMAPKGKEGKEAIEAIKSDLASIESSTPEIQTLVDSNNLIAAQTKASAVKQKATAINTELKTVLEKYMAKR